MIWCRNGYGLRGLPSLPGQWSKGGLGSRLAQHRHLAVGPGMMFRQVDSPGQQVHACATIKPHMGKGNLALLPRNFEQSTPFQSQRADPLPWRGLDDLVEGFGRGLENAGRDCGNQGSPLVEPDHVVGWMNSGVARGNIRDGCSAFLLTALLPGMLVAHRIPHSPRQASTLDDT